MPELANNLILAVFALSLALAGLGVALAVLWRIRNLPDRLATTLEEKHLQMVRDTNSALNELGDRLSQAGISHDATALRTEGIEDLLQQYP